MRRLMLLFAVGTLWLFLAAIPAFADGGPHVMSANSGMSGLTADGCAGCHRAHTAKGGEALLVAPEEQLCESCHGPGALGATTNVWNGVQYDMGATASDRNAGVVLGALRNGGFASAAIGSGNAAHLGYSVNTAGFATRFRPHVPVNQVNGAITGEPVTSAHLAVAGANVTLKGVVWGNGTNANQGVGATNATLECTSCHNPHGNGNFRILRPIPTQSGSGNFAIPTTNAVVVDGPTPAADDTRNYTVLQAVDGTLANKTLTVNQVKALGYSNVAGDYMHRYVPWNATASGTYTGDNPSGQAAYAFNAQITAWCVQCHTRYMSTDYSANSGDPTYTYKHGVNADRGNSCVTCHVSHGSNASMTGDYTKDFPYPGGNPGVYGSSASSRLLKVDNRGTCQACHDPTGTTPAGYYPSTPNPLLP